jgi:hypothetical protein
VLAKMLHRAWSAGSRTANGERHGKGFSAASLRIKLSTDDGNRS